MNKLILVKLGGSVITDKTTPYKANLKNIRNFARQLKKIKVGLVIAHGSGSFGHTSAYKYGGSKGYKNLNGIAKVARDAMEINRIVMDIFIDEGLPAISFRPNSLILAQKGKIKVNFFQTVDLALKQGLIPVFYGDVIWDSVWKSTIFSGETTLDYASSYLKKKGYKIDKIIEVVKTDGILDYNNKTISTINRKNWQLNKKFIFKTKEKDVTGGMAHKIEKALDMTKNGIQTLIINGSRKNELNNALLGKPTKGTLVQ